MPCWGTASTATGTSQLALALPLQNLSPPSGAWPGFQTGLKSPIQQEKAVPNEGTFQC